MPPLPAKALDLRDGHALDPLLREGFLDLVELKRLDDRFDLFHNGLLAADTKRRTAPPRRRRLGRGKPGWLGHPRLGQRVPGLQRSACSTRRGETRPAG